MIEAKSGDERDTPYLVVDDEPDVEMLFRQQFRRDLRGGRFTMEFAQSAPAALQRITDSATGLQPSRLLRHQHAGDDGLQLPKAKAAATFLSHRRSRLTAMPRPSARRWRMVPQALSTKPLDLWRSAAKLICEYCAWPECRF